MKKFSLFVVMALLFTGMYAKADWRPFKHRMNEPVKITVRSVDFYIFPNGEFDFNAHTPKHRPYYGGDYAVRVERDRFGKIRRIGNVFLNYNRYGQVVRIGKVFVKYNRRGLVSRIGRKKIRYGKHGYMVVHTPVYHGSFVAYDYTPGYNDFYDDGVYNEVYYLRSKKKPNKHFKKKKKASRIKGRR